MKAQSFRINPVAFTVLAIGLLAWAAVLIVIAVLGRERIVPHIFDRLRIEHFLSFYGIAFLAAAGLPSLRLVPLMAGLAALAFGVEFARWGLGHQTAIVTADFVCNLAGAAAALAPVVLSRHREAFAGDGDGASTPG